MRLSRTIARPLGASIFIVSGLEVLMNPEPRAKAAQPVVDKVASVIPFAPKDPVDAVKLNAAVHLGAGVLLPGGGGGSPPWLSLCRGFRPRSPGIRSGRSKTR